MSRHRARKRFGQHFLVDPGVIGAIVDAIAVRDGDRIVEIGPGQGALTGLLARTGCEFHAVELDRDLAAHLRTEYADSANVTIHEADALDYVAGYCVCNDVSERAFQIEGTGQWTKGKSCDTFGPIGP